MLLKSDHCCKSAASAGRLRHRRPFGIFRRSVLIPLLVASLPVHSATYVVAPNGKPVAAGTAEFPLNSINAAVSRAKAGDTILVRGGTYHEAVTVRQSGTPAAPIKLQAFPGESPVIDGENKLPEDDWYALIYLQGNYLDASGFELRHSAQRGLVLYGHHTSARQMTVHHTRENGILAQGDYSLVEDCRVYQAALSNYQGAGNGMWAAGLSAARDPANGITDGATLRRNVVYNNWGEGLSTFEADGTLIEDNVVYDNMHVNLYLSDASRALVQRNLVYSTGDSVSLFGRAAQGIGLANETDRNPLDRVTLVNNLVFGTAAPFVYFTSTGPNTLSHALIAYNTFVNGIAGPGSDGITAVFTAGAFTDVRFINNLVSQDDSAPVVFVADGQTGLVFSSNSWSKPPLDQAAAATDVRGDPLLAKTGLTVSSAVQNQGGSGAAAVMEAKPGMLKPDAFRPRKGSPVLERGMPLPEVTTDYFKAARGPKPTIGAIGSPAP